MEDPQPIPQYHKTFTTGRETAAAVGSPEFEFWMVRNPHYPQTKLLSADELFSGGFLLPLQNLQLSDEPPSPLTSESPSATVSKRWTQIFKINEKKISDSVNQASKERKRQNGISAAVTAAELNINIWPFSRSRSAGSGRSRPKVAAATRKVISAPCSRSNSKGETKSRIFAHSPSRGAGVHLGRSSPVWKIRRNNSGLRRCSEISGKISERDYSSSEERPKKISGSRTRILNLNVPMCIGYRNHFSCGSDENSAIAIASAAIGIGGKMSDAAIGGEGVRVRRSSLMGIRNFFTKKVS